MEWQSEDYDYLCGLGELQHTPIDGPRPTHVGENVFAHQWELLMTKQPDACDPPNSRLAYILWGMTREITQRHASVAASFVTWLGCNAGNAFVERGRRMFIDIDSVHRLSREHASMVSWSIENMRSPRKFYRTIDTILAERDDYGPDLFSNGISLRRLPKISAEDVETADHLAYWCGTPDGCEFIRFCNEQIRQRESVTAEQTIRIIAGVHR